MSFKASFGELLTVLGAAAVAHGTPVAASIEEQAACLSDNLLNSFVHTSVSAVPFCQTYIGVYKYETDTVTTDYNSTTTASLTTTQSPSSWLPMTYPASRLSSACSCLSVPELTKQVTVFVASQVPVSSDGASSAPGDSTSSTTFSVITTQSSMSTTMTSLTATSTSTGPATAATSRGVSYSYLGCYSEPSYPNRALPLLTSSTTMTPNVCLGICQKKGYLYAGTEWGRECWCGNVLVNATATDERKCNYTCTGDSSLTCGGSRLLQLHGPPNGALSTPTPTVINLSTSSTTSSTAATTTSSSPTVCNSFQSVATDVYNFPFKSFDDLKIWSTRSITDKDLLTFAPLDTDGSMVLSVSQRDFNMFTDFNAILGATYKVSVHTRITVNTNLIMSVDVLGATKDIDTSQINEWQTAEFEVICTVGILEVRFRHRTNSDTSDVSYQVSNIDIQLVSLGTTSPTPTLETEEIIWVDWRSGSVPATTNSISTFRETPGSSLAMASPASPGYGAYPYAYTTTFNNGTWDANTYLFTFEGGQVDDLNAQYVAKLRYESQDSNGCFIAFNTGMSVRAEVVTGCTDQWYELVSDPAQGNSFSYQVVILVSCNAFGYSTAKFWLDDFVLHKVSGTPPV